MSERRADRAIGRIEPEWIMDLKTKHSQLFRGIAPYIFIDAEGWKGIVAALSVNLDALGMALHSAHRTHDIGLIYMP